MPVFIDEDERRRRVALVFAGGAARGAYEVGVVQHLFGEVAYELGGQVPVDILAGTSVGAINACVLAAHADDQRLSSELLAAHWSTIDLREMLRLDGRCVLRYALGAAIRCARGRRVPGRWRGGLLDPRGIARVVARAVPFGRIAQHLRARHLDAVAVSTTHVGSGAPVVFVQRAGDTAAAMNARTRARSATLALAHVLASSAIPFLFPAVDIDGALYCDGGLRQNVPLSPARRLGADRLFVIHTRHLPSACSLAGARAREAEFAGPLFLLGKALNALILDRVDADIERIDSINHILADGVREYGAGFLEAINRERGATLARARIRPVHTLVMRPSRDLGALAADIVRSRRFARRVGGGAGRLLRHLADCDPDADLLSFLLFDREFAGELIALGRSDARARHEELCAFFSTLSCTRQAMTARERRRCSAQGRTWRTSRRDSPAARTMASVAPALASPIRSTKQ